MLEKIRICYLVSRLGQSGPTKQLLQLISHLDHERFSARIITLSEENSNSLALQFRPHVENIDSLRLGSFSSYLQAANSFKRLESQHPAHIIHSQGIRADLINGYLSNRRIRIATQRNYPFDDYVMEYGLAKGWIISHLHYHAFRRIPHVFSCSETLVKKNIPHRLSSRLVRNGTVIPLLRDFSTEYWRTKIEGYPETRLANRIFVTSGPLIKRKAIKTVIDAFLTYRRNHNHSAKLFVLGDGPELNNLQNQAKGDPDVVFTGLIEDVSPFLRAADLFISASLSEGMPNAVLESLANGAPTLLSDIEPHLELLNLNPLLGRAFPTQNARALTECLTEAFSTKRERQCIYQFARDTFSAAIMANQYQKLYADLRQNELSNAPDHKAPDADTT